MNQKKKEIYSNILHYRDECDKDNYSNSTPLIIKKEKVLNNCNNLND